MDAHVVIAERRLVPVILLAAFVLAAFVLACGGEQETAKSEPAPAEERLVAPGSGLSADGRYRLRLEPRDGDVPLGRLHAWVLAVETADGVPFEPRRLAVSGGMPQHDHGFQTEPRVTQRLPGGEFLIEGVRFHMHGDWTIRLELVGPAGPDVATFHVTVAPDASASALRPDEIAILRSLSIDALSEPPLDPSNRVAADLRAARLGHRLFFDPAMSRSGQISCATCHDPARHFTDGRPTALGLGPGARNTPTVVGAAHAPWLFWDGRRDSLWAQALAPMETLHEMGGTRVEIARLVTGAPRYRTAYEEVFGAAPDFSDARRFPVRASPFGDDEARSAWSRMSPEARQEVNVAFANVGKAIAAYERRLAPGRSRFDEFVARESADGAEVAGDLLSEEEAAGLRLFLDASRTQCLRCHNGPLFTNHGFHDIGSSRRGAVPDLGRHLGIQALLLDEFNCLGPHSDAPSGACQELRFLDRRETPRLSGAYKTPTLRGVAHTGPYFHDGSARTLEEVIAHYRTPPADPGSELLPLEIDDREAAALAAFLRTLSGDVAADPVWLTPPADAPGANQGAGPTGN